ncbi:laccase-12-like protein [Tanacetum coccineum]
MDRGLPALSFLSLLLLFSSLVSLANAKTVYHDFVVQDTKVTKLCKTQNVMTVNGQLPGPTLEVNNGDSLVINVVNKAKENVTIHWHGIRQRTTAWADGPEFITQCPIRPEASYTYKFTISGQEGTLWWHAHSPWVRATVYGAIVIRPKEGTSYPFAKPNRDSVVILGEWWNANPLAVIRESMRTGGLPNISDAYTINGQPGDLYSCSTKETVIVPTDSGETNLIRVINAALNQPLFFSIANHKLTVVGADASYVKPFTTNVLMLGPGETTDVLIKADQPPAQYYIAAQAYVSAPGSEFDNTTTTAILEYNKGSSSKPVMPTLPAFDDTATATAFTTSFRSPNKVSIPTDTDENLFITAGVGISPCPPNAPSSTCQAPFRSRFTASMNNVSFVPPSNFSILQAHYQSVPGVFTNDFPAKPPVAFDYTGTVSRSLWTPISGTKVYKLKYGSKVQIVLQVGFGNFNPATDTSKFNLVDPPLRNTVSLPVNGWAVIRFVADNPGAWIMHCHLDFHIGWGLAMVFLVENGVGKLETLPQPPADLPLRKAILVISRHKDGLDYSGKRRQQEGFPAMD